MIVARGAKARENRRLPMDTLDPSAPRRPARRAADRARRRRRRSDRRRRVERARRRHAARSHAFLTRAARDRLRVAGHRLDAALPHRVARARAVRRAAALRQDALVRRVRVRLGVGGCLSPLRAPLLPEARRRHSVHARAGPAAPRPRRDDARRADRRPRSRCCSRRARVRAPAVFVAARAVPDRDRGARAARRPGMMIRHGVQFRWENPGYRDFADFLATFNHDKRKKVKQERRKVADSRRHVHAQGRRRDHGRRLGVLLSLLREHVPRAPFDAVSVARVLRAHRRDACRTTC